MASNSKKRRRVLGASCILAALIIASSSFAWFTSQDEVTNRLAANADYDVRIVESFAPPKNWLPGQNVKKEVYAVNTGTIPAFVKEEISGVLTVTREIAVPSADFADEKANLVTLTEAERYVIEAGANLAYKPAEDTYHELGDQIVSMTPSSTDLNGYIKAGTTDFTPLVNGLYVFRRSIGVNDDSTESFTYDAYYFNDGNYYKVNLGTLTPADVANKADDGETKDGNLSAATYTLAKDSKEVVDPAELTYEADQNRLVVTYAGLASTVTKATLDGYADALNTAEHNYRAAEAAWKKAVADNAAASDNLTALQAILAEKGAIYDALVAKKNAKQTERDNVNGSITTKSASKTTLDGTTIPAKLTALYGTGTSEANADGGLYKTYTDAKAAREAAPNDAGVAAFYTELRGYMTSISVDPTGVADSDLLSKLTYAQIKAFNVAAADEAHDYYTLVMNEIDAKKAYEDAKAELDDLYAQSAALQSEIEALTARRTALDDELTILNGADTVDGSVAKALKEKTAAETAVTTATNGTSATATANLSEAVAAYNSAKSAYTNALNTYNTAYAAYMSATKDLKIYINLDGNVGTTPVSNPNNYWQLIPADPSTTDVAEFYYTGLLEGGETSTMLVKSVELDKNTELGTYKSFDFDLNVALKSAQVAYDTDNETILGTAATAEFGKTPTLVTPKDVNTAVTWPTT